MHAVPLLRRAAAYSWNAHQAPGEAEAELAWLNQTGVIDAVLTDDVDALVFGALTVIKKCVLIQQCPTDNLNPSHPSSSLKLSGNKANKSKLKEPIPKGHVEIYTAKDIYEHPAVAMTRAGLILIALMSGGDYDKVLMTIVYLLTTRSSFLQLGNQRNWHPYSACGGPVWLW